ncbi:hypothetical protein P7C73_g993, partial [Tremellales sp. Uapishka_1]
MSPFIALKPKILLIGESTGNLECDASIREIADVTVLPTLGHDEAVVALKTLVEEKGPFVAFGVGAIVERGRRSRLTVPQATFTPGKPFPGPFDRALLEPLMPDLGLCVGPGAGYDKVDIDFLTSSGAIYANTPTRVGMMTADGALALILSATRALTAQDHSVRKGGWKDNSILTKNWRDSTLGIVGMGNIGQQIADMSTALGMKVVYSNRRPKSESPHEYVSLDDLFARADIVVLTCPLTLETRYILRKETFAKMKDGVIVVNVARGGCVNENDLVDALDSGKVLRAALDVFENEPTVHPGLLSNPNVTLSPHNAGAIDISWRAINAEIVQNIAQYIETGKPLTPVNLEALKAGGHKV